MVDEIVRRLFCRTISTRISDKGKKHTVSFKLDNLDDDNELIKFELVYYGRVPTVWHALIHEIEHNDRIEIVIRDYDPRQTRLVSDEDPE